MQLPKFNVKVGKTSVKIEQKNIINASTDCIANACNSKLDHAGGIAFDISFAAGKKYDDECRNIVNAQKGGRLPVTSAVMTGPGKLKNVARIVNVVGPNFKAIKDRSKACKLLAKSYENMFAACEKEEIISLTTPLISGGECHAKTYYENNSVHQNV